MLLVVVLFVLVDCFVCMSNITLPNGGVFCLLKALSRQRYVITAVIIGFRALRVHVLVHCFEVWVVFMNPLIAVRSKLVSVCASYINLKSISVNGLGMISYIRLIDEFRSYKIIK